jgi:hypothetical protein
MNRFLSLTILALLLLSPAVSAESEGAGNSRERRRTDNYGGIHWDIEPDEPLPHQNHMAMSGQSVALILEWEVDAEGHFHSTSVVHWLMQRAAGWPRERA